MKKILFLFFTINSKLLFAAYPFDNFAYLYTQQPYGFSSGPYHTYLTIPIVEFNNHLYTDIRLKLEENGQYSLEQYKKLPDDEENLVRKINNSSCVINDTFGRFVANIAFLNGNQKYCLVRSLTGTDPGFYMSYLFIENGTATLIQDTRYEPYQSNPEIYIVSDDISSINFGSFEDQIFIEQADINQIDFEKKSTLKLFDKLGNLITHF
ncbi:MAG: hypothetical protein KZQ83_17955 [gamma proteobacterium symbiont of Taylorina sp.]|nr:hypothetical protein [gamma proteobacterium symbiont of Taylorina sp.]